jgi:hypothetical protein
MYEENSMPSTALKAALQERLPILFAYIGWAKYYDGTEPIHGNFSWLKGNPTQNWEANAFLKSGDGYFYCGVGDGVIVEVARLHVVFVARHPVDHELKVVGIYAAANVVPRNEIWTQVRTKNAILLPAENRPSLPQGPGAQGVRRWAWRDGAAGVEHPTLRRFFNRLKANIAKGNKSYSKPNADYIIDDELEGFEGERKKRFVNHRKREARLRREKIREALMLERFPLILERIRHCGSSWCIPMV